MTIQRFKIALNAARFPLVSSKGQRAVFIPGLDSAPRTPRIFMGNDEAVDYNMAQVVYCENVMPLTEGIRSVGYSQLIAPSANTDFNQLFALRDDQENTVLYSPSAGQNYIYDDVAGAWTTTTFAAIHGAVIDPASPNTEATAKVTYAYVDGKTFVCYSRVLKTGGTDASILYWNPATKALEPAGALITNLSFAAGTIDGISSSNGYLLVYSNLTVAWAIFGGAAFDFTIYANNNYTGSGYQIPEDVQGPIRAVVSVSGGFLIFTSKNCIASNYHAQNIQAPWVFREVANAGGIESYEQATVEGSLGYVVAYTTTGIQKVTLNSAEDIFPDVTDFISGRYIERYNFTSHELREGAATLDMYVKLTAIANRFLVVSYGTYPGVYSFALVYDNSLRRWGKLRMVHRDCFYYSYGVTSASPTYAMLGDLNYEDFPTDTYASLSQTSETIVAAPHGLAFLLATGEVKIANWSNQLRDTQDESVAIIGRIQLSRNSNMQLNRGEFEGLKSGSVFVQPSYNGKNLATAEQMVTIEAGDNYLHAGCMIDCKNFNLVIDGTFDLSTVILEATTSGKF